MDVPQLIGRVSQSPFFSEYYYAEFLRYWDISNPAVGPHLNFYPEVSSNVSEAWQASKWQDGVPLDHLTPMYADGGKHYYVNELCRLHNGTFVIPQRWIKRDNQLTADCKQVFRVDDPSGQDSVSPSECQTSTLYKVFSGKATSTRRDRSCPSGSIREQLLRYY